MTTLNKRFDDEGILWETDDFFSMGAPDEMGYHLINRNTGVIELLLEQETQVVIALQQLQASYDEIMKDPVAKYEEVESERRVQRARHNSPQLVQ